MIDMRRTLRASMKAGGALIDLKYLGPREKQPPIVALLDISGSMSQYTRLFLHFLHAITEREKRVTTFLFGTRLTNVTRAIRERDPDEALAACSAHVADWSGGTRIATSLQLSTSYGRAGCSAQGAIVLLITDGLERDADDTLAFEIDRLHRSCRRLIWLNPLLRFEGFEAQCARACGRCCRTSTSCARSTISIRCATCASAVGQAVMRRSEERLAERGVTILRHRGLRSKPKEYSELGESVSNESVASPLAMTRKGRRL